MKAIPLVLSLALALGVSALAEDNQCKSAFIPDEPQQEMEELRAKIEAEAAKLPDDHWAGLYLQENCWVAVAPHYGFLYESYGCCPPFFRLHGSVAEFDDQLYLSLECPVISWYPSEIYADMIPIRWGERFYLSPPGQMKGFCNYVNSGEEPRNSMYGFCYLREGDEAKPAPGLPQVPEEYRKWLLEEPLEATILEVGDLVTKETKYGEDTGVWFKIDAGSSDGVFEGMRLWVMEPSAGGSFWISSVDENTSNGWISTGASDRVPTLGASVTSRSPRGKRMRAAAEEAQGDSPRSHEEHGEGS
ncbi:hypothetical protein KQI84_17765 [bacterium]|nr:hypothetical protein [bacterium]